MCVRTHSRVLLVVGLMVIPSYKDSGYESFYLTNLLHLNCKSVSFLMVVADEGPDYDERLLENQFDEFKRVFNILNNPDCV